MKYYSCFGLVVGGIAAALFPATASEKDFKEVTAPFAVKKVVVQKTWINGEVPSATNWKPVRQDDLASRLSEAPKLSFEFVAPPPKQIGYGPKPFLCPNPDGKSWDIVSTYRKKYHSEGQIYVHDLATGENKSFSYGTGKRAAKPGEKILFPYQSDFHMKSSWYINMKLYFKIPAGRGGIDGEMFLVYDPAINDFVSKTVPFEQKSLGYGAALGSDGRIYGCRLRAGKGKFYYYIYDPKTYKTEILPPVDYGQKHPFPHYRGFAKKGDWAYAKFGHKPWHLTAYNFKTGEFRHLGKSKDIMGDHRTIRVSNAGSEGLYGHIREPAEIAGIENFDKKEFKFWLHDGRIYARTNDTPPWSNAPLDLKQRRRGKNWQWGLRCREFQKWPGDFWSTVSQPPEVKDWSVTPKPDGTVELKYRFPAEDGKKSDTRRWETITHKVNLYDNLVRRVIEIDGKTLFATDEGYGQQIIYDLKNQRLKRYPALGISPYSLGVHSGSVYVCGYPHMRSARYEVAALEEKEPEFLGYLGKGSDTHTPLGGVISGADGCMYVAGVTSGRRRSGGGLSWYNPQTEEKGFAKGIEDQRIFWTTAANDGRYILLSSKAPDGGRIWCWDTQRKAFIYNIKSPEGCGFAGPLEEALPGLVMGFAVGGKKGSKGTLYGLDPATGKYLWTKPIPAGSNTAFSQVRRHNYSFRRGPDGFIWATLGGVLARINPRTVEVIPVGKAGDLMIAFANDGVYTTGKGLHKIKNLEVKSID